MNDVSGDPGSQRSSQSLMDELLRAGVPEIKLALGEVIDRENARPLPPKYARLLPDTLLSVTLRPDAAEALGAFAADLERELTDSCNRHGSLYDRSYRVQLLRAGESDAPLYAVTTHASKEISDIPDPAPASGQGSVSVSGQEPGSGRGSGSGPGQGSASESPLASGPGQPLGSAPGAAAPKPPPTQRPLPIADPETTRVAASAPSSWEPGRWLLVVEGSDGGEDREAFRLGEPLVTVGRGSDDPGLRASIAISDAPHVSRRQLALIWEERDGAPGFRVYNVGLNAVHLPGLDIAGAHAGKGPIDLDSVADEHTGWLPPGVPLRIGDHGPTLRIDEIPLEPEEVAIDPDATVFE